MMVAIEFKDFFSVNLTCSSPRIVPPGLDLDQAGFRLAGIA
jgi:hypothetical protein